MHVLAARPGLLVVDRSMNVVASNAEALQILTFPEPPAKIRHLDAGLSSKMRSQLIDRQAPRSSSTEYRSGKRTYLFRTFPLELAAGRENGSAPSSNGLLVVMFERKSNGDVKMAEIAERFHLTAREQETVQLLLQGLTSKEIAQRMGISPNTVKAFIRLVMVKMGVSTRSGIIGQIVGPKG